MKRIAFILLVFISAAAANGQAIDTTKAQPNLYPFGYKWISGGFRNLYTIGTDTSSKMANQIKVINGTVYASDGVKWRPTLDSADYFTASISFMKLYSGFANRIHVVATNEDYVICSPCTADEVTIYAGAGGRKWKRVYDSTLTATVATKAPIASPTFTGIAKLSTDTLATKAYARSVGGSGASVAGATKQIQFNKSGVFSTDSTFTFEKGTGIKSNTVSAKRVLTGDTLFAAGTYLWFFGNSITRGSQADSRFTFPQIISRAFNATEVVRAIDGTGLYGASCADSNMVCRIAGIPTYTAAYRYLSFLYGPQGGSADTTVDNAAYRTAYYTVIDAAIAKGWPLNRIVIFGWVQTNLPGGPTINPKITALQDSIATEKGVNFINTYAYMVANGNLELVDADNIHTNTKGHAVIAEAFFDKMRITKRTGFEYLEGSKTVSQNLIVGDSLIVDNTATFGKPITVSSTTNRSGVHIINTSNGASAYGGVKFSNLFGVDTFRMSMYNGAGNIPYFLIGNQAFQHIGLYANGRIAYGSVSSTSPSYGHEFTGTVNLVNTLRVGSTITMPTIGSGLYFSGSTFGLSMTNSDLVAFTNWNDATKGFSFKPSTGGFEFGSNAVNNASAIVAFTSTTKGVLLPRMTKAQRDAIVSPPDGLEIYQTDNTPGKRTRENGVWVKYTTTAD